MNASNHHGTLRVFMVTASIVGCPIKDYCTVCLAAVLGAEVGNFVVPRTVPSA